MGRVRKIKLIPIGEDVLRRVAKIMGECSAAQQALDRAAEIRAKGHAVKFYQSNTNHIIVEDRGTP
jgi:hypothetical protein